jgi:hypothetical protein
MEKCRRVLLRRSFAASMKTYLLSRRRVIGSLTLAGSHMKDSTKSTLPAGTEHAATRPANGGLIPSLGLFIEGVTIGEFAATAVWDVLNAVDPIAITDLMEWLFIK